MTAIPKNPRQGTCLILSYKKVFLAYNNVNIQVNLVKDIGFFTANIHNRRQKHAGADLSANCMVNGKFQVIHIFRG